MNIKEVFSNVKINEKGDIAYNSTTNKYLDILFNTELLTKQKKAVDITFLNSDSEYDRLFAMFIRDVRNGLGRRDLGRDLLKITKETPSNIIEIGRADDVFYIGLDLVRKTGEKDNEYFSYLRDVLENKDHKFHFNVTKWLPKLNRPKIEGKRFALNKDDVKVFRDSFPYKMSEKDYRKITKNTKTIESKILNNEEIKYETVPSLAMLRYSNRFSNVDSKRFEEYLENVKNGKSKINVTTTNVYDIMRYYTNDKINSEQADILFNAVKKVELPKIITVLDNSGSMYDDNNSYLKARAIAHYVSKNSSYMNNHIITFSSYPSLLELSDNYEEDCKILSSFRDVSNTRFDNVMKLLAKANDDLPDYILVLSDMEFDSGSHQAKGEAMDILKKYNPNLKIIWWNFNTRNTTAPETDNYGNFFLSGYNPMLLSLLEHGMDANAFLNKIINDYKEKVKDIVKL